MAPEHSDYGSNDTHSIAHSVLMGEARALRFGRRILSHIPSYPRCKLCGAPFGGVGGPVMRLVGKGPWPKNPKYCSMCFKEMAKRREGAEIECSLLFADVRGSTPMAESMRPLEFRERMGRFFDVATSVLVDYEAVVDQFVGDEVIALFIPALTGELHAKRAIDAGRALLAATASRTDAAWVPIGAGVNTGVAFVGAVGAGDNVEFTAMGDPVNVTARLASAAAEGELLVTLAAAASAHLVDNNYEHRRLKLKGKSEPTEVLVLGPSA